MLSLHLYFLLHAGHNPHLCEHFYLFQLLTRGKGLRNSKIFTNEYDLNGAVFRARNLSIFELGLTYHNGGNPLQNLSDCLQKPILGDRKADQIPGHELRRFSRFFADLDRIDSLL